MCILSAASIQMQARVMPQDPGTRTEPERATHHYSEIYPDRQYRPLEDIDLHRRIMGIAPTDDDREGLTMPEIFSYPCSPHLASRIDGRPIDFDKIERATEELSRRYDVVLLEGAGGLMVPLTDELLTIDYIAQKEYPLLFVTSGKLGSINHTLLSLEAIKNRGIKLDTVLYNLYPTVEDRTIQEDTQLFIQRYLKKDFPEDEILHGTGIIKSLQGTSETTIDDTD